MLQKLNQKIQGLVAWTFVIIIGITFTLWGVSGYLGNGQRRDIVAKVNGEKITQYELRRAIGDVRRITQQRMGDKFELTPDLSQQIKAQAIQRLINTRLLLQDAHRLGFFISDAQVENLIVTLPYFQEKGRFSQKKFDQLLRMNGIAPRTYIDMLKSDLVITQLRTGILGSAVMGHAAFEQAVGLLKEQRDFQYLVVPAKNFIAKQTVTDAEIQAYYKEHQADFYRPENVSLHYIRFTLDDVRQRIKITDQQIADYYRENLANFQSIPAWRVSHIVIGFADNASPEEMDNAKRTAKSIKAQLDKGADFAKLAKKHSTDILSAAKGGALQWMDLQNVDKTFADTVKALKSGQISTVVRTSYGYDIIKLDAYKPASTLPLAKVKNRIQTRLQQEMAQKQFAKNVELLANETFANPDTLKTAANRLKLKVQTVKYMTAQGGDDPLAKQKKIQKAAFSDDVLVQGNNSDVIQITPEEALVLRVATHQKAQQKPLQSVKAGIIKRIRQQKSENAAVTLGQSLLSSLNMKKSVATQLKTHDLKWRTEKRVERSSHKLDQELLVHAFQVPTTAGKIRQGLAGYRLDSGDYIIIKVLESRLGNMTGFTKNERKMLEQELSNSKGMLEYQLYLKGLIKKAKIDDNTGSYQGRI